MAVASVLSTSIVGAKADVMPTAWTLASRLAALRVRKRAMLAAVRLKACASRTPTISSWMSAVTSPTVSRVARKARRARLAISVVDSGRQQDHRPGEPHGIVAHDVAVDRPADEPRAGGLHPRPEDDEQEDEADLPAKRAEFAHQAACGGTPPAGALLRCPGHRRDRSTH